jgi:phosphatidylglycerol---prolipoprotein diacylglyceryl transferase
MTTPVFAWWVHDLSPHIIRFTDRLALHWYGLAYVLGFYLCYLVMRRLARRSLSEIKESSVADFITYTALFGVVLGGRLGYMLLYNFQGLLADPLSIVRIMDGGMSSHGGIAGVALFLLWYALKHGISWTGLGDSLVAGAPLGIFTVRIANFINGELFGRVTQVPWAVKFPTEVTHQDFLDRYEAKFGDPFPFDQSLRHSPEILEVYSKVFGSREDFVAVLNPRHPSQLYEALGEGLFLFLLLYWLRVRYPQLPHGVLTGLFFILYAVARISLEFLREPDSGAARTLGLTMGQFYSTFMILAGLAFIGWGLISGRRKAA